MTIGTTRPATGLTIAEAAERTGLSAHTLRYYERDGLMLAAVDRASTGHRRYSETDLRWITMLTCLRATGMPVRDVRTYADLCRSGGQERERLALLRAHRERVRAELSQVQEHLGAIDDKIDLYVAQVGDLDHPDDDGRRRP